MPLPFQNRVRALHAFVGTGSTFRRHWPAAALLLSICSLGIGGRGVYGSRRVLAATAVASVATRLHLDNPDQVCRQCHQDIYDRYERTPMALGSGLAADGLALDRVQAPVVVDAAWTHAPSAITYQMKVEAGRPVLSFARSPAATGGELHGNLPMVYFVGSGHRGRTYLYQDSDQWYEAPINWYGKKQIWDMAPAFEQAATLPAALPVDANCLHCHATGVQTPAAEARNRFSSVPFTQGGVGCSACHGDATAHVRAGGHGLAAAIVNPAKLSVARRDSACVQCHLEGDATVYRAGTSLADFKPGDDLSERAVYFVRASREAGGGRASSQYEALLRSACKRGAGDALTCTTCHDPHGSPAPAERVAWFRARCLSCHSSPAIAVNHHPEQQDCAVCHMPTRAAADISHEQATDHNIQRRPPPADLSNRNAPRIATPGGMDELVPVGDVKASDRDLGLAYAQMAVHGDRQAGERALLLLRRAEASGANDVQLHSELGFLDQLSGDRQAAAREYRAALAGDPFEATALGNLAVLDAAAGQVQEAKNLLTRVVTADPGKTAAGLNLAFLQCSTGEKRDAAALLQRLARVNPDDAALREFQRNGVYAGRHCSLTVQSSTGTEKTELGSGSR